jgi:hypothetical protein
MQFDYFKGETIKGREVFKLWSTDLLMALIEVDLDGLSIPQSLLYIECTKFISDTIKSIDNDETNTLFDCWMFCEMLSDHVTYHIGVLLETFGSKAKLETDNQRIHTILEQFLSDIINDKKYEDYIEEATYIVKTPDKKPDHWTFYIGSKEINLQIKPSLFNEISDNLLIRFQMAASKGFVTDIGQPGIKKLAEYKNLLLTEVKILGSMQDGKCTAGNSRLVCIWNNKDNIMYVFALQNHKEVFRTTEAFKKDPELMYQGIMKQFNLKNSYVEMITKGSSQGFSHGY